MTIIIATVPAVRILSEGGEVFKKLILKNLLVTPAMKPAIIPLHVSVPHKLAEALGQE